eukprot:m.56141 g.56141  ORF g.56141 m.56141 type:complete len:59 (-) comp12016_c0_seq2:364-540(-)
MDSAVAWFVLCSAATCVVSVDIWLLPSNASSSRSGALSASAGRFLTFLVFLLLVLSKD